MSENFFVLFFNVYLNEDLSMPTGQIGTIFAVGRLAPFFISPLLPLALYRWGAGRVLTAGYVLMAFFILLMASGSPPGRQPPRAFSSLAS